MSLQIRLVAAMGTSSGRIFSQPVSTRYFSYQLDLGLQGYFVLPKSSTRPTLIQMQQRSPLPTNLAIAG